MGRGGGVRRKETARITYKRIPNRFVRQTDTSERSTPLNDSDPDRDTTDRRQTYQGRIQTTVCTAAQRCQQLHSQLAVWRVHCNCASRLVCCEVFLPITALTRQSLLPTGKKLVISNVTGQYKSLRGNISHSA